MYQQLNIKQVKELVLLRRGWFTPEYELTDNVNSYGALTYSGLSKRRATAITATGKWQFSFKGIFSRTILITDEHGMVIGTSTREFFSRKRTLTMQSGFTAVFYRPAFFSRAYVWESAGYGRIMRIKNHYPFTLTTHVNIYNTQTPVSLIPLLIFLGAHLIVLRRRKKAAH